MADTYKLRTKTNADIAYDDIQVEVIDDAPVTVKGVVTVLELKNEKALLQGKMDSLDTIIAAVGLEADKVLTATR